MSEFIFGEQITLDSYILQADNAAEQSRAEQSRAEQSRAEQSSWLIDILGEDYNGSEVILDSFVKAHSVINDLKYKKIMCSISGGADSDCMLHLIHSIDFSHKVDYIWFNTGLSYQAEREQLKYLEEKYGIEIKHYNAIKPIPLTCRTIGQPFISKRVSNEIARGQRYGFKWEDEPFDILIQRYPKCKQFLRWWCNDWEGGSKSNFNISHNKYLKEFLISNPPWFKISDDCCHWAKKEVGLKCYKEGDYDLSLYGVRKAEGGTRATAYTNCFTEQTSKGTTEYRPLYWWSNNDKAEFEQRFGIIHSKCYTEMGLSRTGCPACPYGRDFEHELEILAKYESNMYKAVNNIFKDAYEYTRMYREFCKNSKEV